MNVLFLCVANSARSQIAEGLARQMMPAHSFQSAGSQPSVLNPFAVKALQEIGVDIATHYSKSVDSIDLAKIDLIVTLCAEEVCPAVLAKVEKLHWPTPDPAGSGDTAEGRLTAFRQARESIRERLLKFKEDRKL